RLMGNLLVVCSTVLAQRANLPGRNVVVWGAPVAGAFRRGGAGAWHGHRDGALVRAVVSVRGGRGSGCGGERPRGRERSRSKGQRDRAPWRHGRSRRRVASSGAHLSGESRRRCYVLGIRLSRVSCFTG